MSRFSILENGLKIAWIYSRTDQIFHLDFACWHQLVAACLGSGPPWLQCSAVSHPDAAKVTPFFSDSRLSPLQFAKSPSFGLPCFSPHPFSKTKYCTIPLISSGYIITLYANAMIDGYDQAKVNALIASDLFCLLWCSNGTFIVIWVDWKKWQTNLQCNVCFHLWKPRS